VAKERRKRLGLALAVWLALRSHKRLALTMAGWLLVLLAVAALRSFGPGFLGGIVVGAALTVGALAGGLSLFVRRAQREIGQGLQPAPARRLQGWDYVLRLRAPDGSLVEGNSFRGKVLFINFWATWCAPCVAEMPSIERLVARLAGRDIAVVCVTREPADTVQAFVAKKRSTAPIYRIEGVTPEIFETRSIPATFVVDRQGNIALQHTGAARWDTDEIVSLLLGL
jgi:thiol-disulfide isomerase/thioredoxin